MTETIGFGQVADSVLEGETKMARVRFGPQATNVNVSGRELQFHNSENGPSERGGCHCHEYH